MKDLGKEHRQITDNVKNIIKPMKIVFPADYGRIYREIAYEYNIELTPDELLNSEMLDAEMIRYVITLTECTEEAVNAIESSDKEKLKLILLKTKQLQQEVESLQKIIYEDTLTHTLNRKWFEDKLLNVSKTNFCKSGILVVIDLDHFKMINDNYGHLIGDKVLSLVAMKLKEIGGHVIRYGGDEFIVIFDLSTTFDIASDKLETLIKYFNKIYIKAGNHQFQVSFSYGMTIFSPQDDVTHIIEEADRAMYLQKHSKNCN